MTLTARVVARYLSRTSNCPVRRDHTARSFPNQEALNRYLQEHPNAHKNLHHVEKSDARADKKEAPAKDEKAKDGEEAPSGRTPASPKKPKALFDAAEMKLGPDVAQKEKDPTKLFAAAKVAFEQQLDWLNHGKGLDKAMGAKVIRADDPAKDPDAQAKAMDQKGPVIVIGPMKKQDRSAQKVEADFGGDWTKLGDIVRATVAVDSMDQIEDVMTKLRASGLKLARKPKDRFAEPTEAGYRDLMMNVVYPNGHVGEVQIHLKPVLKAKALGHKYYDDIRKIEEAAKKEGRTTMTEEETKTLNDANAKSKALYDKAWKEATGASEAKTATQRVSDRFAAASTKYYDHDGQAARWEPRKFPVVLTPKGAKVVYELEKFFQTAQTIDKDAFDAIQKATEK